jgi:exonuclease III
MKIISWNCSGGFRKKFKEIEKLDPEILIIQECENPEKYESDFKDFKYTNYIWNGDSENKGIGIFFKTNIEFNELKWNGTYEINIPEINSDHLSWQSKDLKQFLPVSINNNLNILAVWTKGRGNQTFKYIGQFWKYILANKKQITQKPTIIIGDFNSNKIWDKIDRWWNHSEVINILESWNFKSLYHKLNMDEQGKERIPTFYLHRKFDRAYHIDYIFMPEGYIEKSKIKIGKFNEWIKFSDHMPLIVEFEN